MKTRIIILLFLLSGTNAFCQFMAGNTSQDPVDLPSKPGLIWKFKTNGPVVATPVIDDGIVYVGSLDSNLYAFNLLSGKQLWKVRTGGPIRSSVAISRKRLFLLSSDGFLYRMDADSGKVDGVFQTMNGYSADRQYDLSDYFNSTPVIRDSTIYFGSGDYIYAVSITDGYLKWTFKAGDLVHTKPAIDRGTLYAGSFDGFVYAIDINTGSLVWKFKTTGKYSFPRGEVTGNPVVARGMVFAGARDYNFYAIDQRGGYVNWMKQFPYGWSLPVTVNDSAIYVGTSDDRSLCAFDIRSGREYWRCGPLFNIFGGCVVGNQQAVFGTLAGKVYAVNLTTGKVVWTIELDSYKANHLKWLKADDSYRDDMASLISTPHDMLKMYEQLGGIFGAPAMETFNMVVGCYDGTIYCFSGSKKGE